MGGGNTAIGARTTMTATIVDLKCPACGHLIGQEEYERVVANFNRIVEEKYSEVIENKANQIAASKVREIEITYQEELAETRSQSGEEIRRVVSEIDNKNRLIEDMQHNIEDLANQKATSKIEEMERKYNEELEQSHINKEDDITRAVREKESQHEEERAGYRKHIERLEKDNTVLTAAVEEQKKKIENMSSEYRGTRGEIHLLDILQSEFPNDKLVPKKVGVEMADVIQTVVENKEKIAPPIVWDRKTSDKVTAADICKAKKYMTTHNTNYSIIVTQKGITTKDSHNTVFGIREGIYLVHPTAVVDIAGIFRSFIIDKAKQNSSNKDRTSKQAKLYEYLKSPEYGRTVEMMREAKTKLDDLQRREENYHKDTWKNRTKIIEAWSRIVEQIRKKIDDVMRDQTSEDSQDDQEGE